MIGHGYLMPEERVALILAGPVAIQKEIAARKVLLDQMVGSLWPSVLKAEIAELQALLEGMAVPA